MLNREQRATILQLKKEGHGTRAIAKLLNVSRNSVKKVLAQKVVDVPTMEREELLDDYKLKILELNKSCKGNLVRVCEKLNDTFEQESKLYRIHYSTLTGYCRRNNIGTSKKLKSSGEYHFAPGEEMQHDTSPHKVLVGGRQRKLQCASVVLCFSRMTYMQVFETFNRFIAKVFLTDAIKYFNGAARSCMIDNTHVIVSSGSGPGAKMAPEMVAFGDRFGMTFNAHRIGDANRSARVERPFRYFENNFYPGREFKNLKDLNAQAIAWCNKNNRHFRRHLNASPLDLFQTENVYLQPLPPFIPEVDALHHRSVGLDGYISLHSNRYSAPDDYINRDVRIRETKNKVQIFHGHKLIAEHERREHGAGEKTRLPAHRRIRAKSDKTNMYLAKEEGALSSAEPVLIQYVQALKKKYGARSSRHIKRLYNLFIEYPADAFTKAVERAFKYGQMDIGILEEMVLKNIAGDFFNLFRPEEEIDYD